MEFLSTVIHDSGHRTNLPLLKRLPVINDAGSAGEVTRKDVVHHSTA